MTAARVGPLVRARRSARELLLRLDVDVRRYRSNSITWRRVKYLDHVGITTVLDVGANRGQYGEELRRGGYQGQIHSFEPLPEPFARLQELAADDRRWTAHQHALGPSAGVSTLLVAGNTDSSSLLPMLHRHVEAAPGTAIVDKVEVEVRTLDDVGAELLDGHGRVMLKLDVQGFEREVLAGGSATLPSTHLIECELSLVPLYESQPLMAEMLLLLDGMGFEPMWMEQGFVDLRTDQLLQVDGIFVRKDPGGEL